MTDTAQPETAAETEAVDPIEAAANAFKTFDESAPDREDRPRDANGRFVGNQPEIEAEEEAEESEPEAESQEVEQEADEAAEEAQPEAVDLPTSWPSEMAETWKSLPPETQDFIVKREGERDAAVNAKFQEAANLRKANEAEINEAKTNRQRFAEAADFLMSMVQPQKPPASMLNPNSSDYNPDAYHLGSRRYEEQVGLLQTVAQQRSEIAQQEQAESERARAQRVAEINSKHMPDLEKALATYDVTTNREDLSDAVYRISPVDTPFMSAVPRAKATAVLHEWSLDTIEATNTTNARLEGDALTRATSPRRPGSTTTARSARAMRL
jgi:hypothetical protein